MIGYMTGSYVDQRPIVSCRLAASGGFDANNAGGIELTALIDTGCTDFMIPSDIVQRLSLVSHEFGENHTAAGIVQTAAYRVDVGFDLLRPDGGLCRYKVRDAKAAELPRMNHYDIVIGMGTLKTFRMIFEPNFGQFRLECLSAD